MRHHRFAARSNGLGSQHWIKHQKRTCSETIPFKKTAAERLTQIMRPAVRPLYLILLFGLFIAGGWYFGTSENEANHGSVSLVQVQPSWVSIAWESPEPYMGSVSYHPIGSDKEKNIVRESSGPVREHQVTIEGLAPGTRYVYAIDRSEKKYHFQTQPEQASAFSFMILWGEAVARAGDYLLSEMPAFYLLLSDPAKHEKNAIEEIRPYVPFFSYNNDSLFPRYKGRAGHGPAQSWNIQWAGLNLICLGDLSSFENNADTLAAHTNAVILPFDLFTNKEGPCSLSRACIEQSALHTTLGAYNREHPDHPVYFVLITGQAMTEFDVGSIKYLGLPTRQSNAGALRVDVHGESVYAAVLDKNKEIVLKKPPLVKYRTCEDCRRLATRGAYQESIAAYREFIANNKAHYQLDDAYYAIAEIHDTKLFGYKEALTWYQRLAARYPESALTPLAEQRTAFIQAHADHDYEPLKRFENIKRTTSGRADPTGRQKTAVLEKAEQILSDFPESSLALTISYWLANQYRSVSPQKAIHWYKSMIDRFHGHPDTQTLWWDIGLVYYEAEQYSDALQAFQKAKAQQPMMEKEIDIQVQRVKRNRLREVILWASRVLLAFLVAVSFLKKPFGLERRSLWIALVIFITIGCIYAIAAWLIHEQFASFREIVLLVGGFTALLSLGYPLSRAFTYKVIMSSAQKERVTFAGSLKCVIVHAIFISTGVYQIIYHTNRHYLVIIGL